MLKSESLQSKITFRRRRTVLAVLFVLVAFVVVLPLAPAQSANDFSLTMNPFPNPDAIDPGGTTTANVTIVAGSTFNDPVDLACQVTWKSQPTPPIPPTCEVSPPSVTGSGGASVTVVADNTAGAVTPLLYTVTVTGTDSLNANLSHSQAQNLTVLAVAPQFTITVQTTIQPTSVAAGSGAQGVISINPINGYVSPGGQAGVTLSCSSITPLVTLPPVCSFNPAAVVVNGTPATSTITISTYGPVITGAAAHPHGLYALWLSLPMLALAGLGAAMGGKRARKAWGLLALFTISGMLLLTPACANSAATSSTPNGVTPANTYTFTVTGVDSDGNISSNTGTTTTNPSVTLTVTAPTN